MIFVKLSEQTVMNIINQLILVMEKYCASFEVGIEFLNIIKMNFVHQRVNFLCSYIAGRLTNILYLLKGYTAHTTGTTEIIFPLVH
jgi:uncharacterized protein YejL (UPF0352 family)